MNTNGIARHYDTLTAEERFRLIVAAGARKDEVEQERLKTAGNRITLSMADHAPYSHAFNEIAVLIFAELTEDAARFWDMGRRFSDAFDDESALQSKRAKYLRVKRGRLSRSLADHTNDLYFVAGFLLKTKAAGWSLWCDRLGIPPFAAWEGLPGLDRLQRSIELADRQSFVIEGMVRWMNRVRPDREPKVTADRIVSANGFADELERLFRRRSEWWGG